MLIEVTTNRKRNHVTWLVNYIREKELPPIKHTLDECYALLAPVMPGSTLVMSTPRRESVKGTITRVGTRIVKTVCHAAQTPRWLALRLITGQLANAQVAPSQNLHLQLQTQHAQTVTLHPKSDIHIPQLDTLSHHLNDAIRTIKATLDFDADGNFMKAQLRVLSQLVADSAAILKGPPREDPDSSWTTQSCPPEHFDPELGRHTSWYFGLQDSLIVLWIRILEPVDAPVHLGTKLGLAIGTVRRLEHDETGLIFDYVLNKKSSTEKNTKPNLPPRSPGDPIPPQVKNSPASSSGSTEGIVPGEYTPIHVREKVRVETADPKLMSLSAKLNSVKATLSRVEANIEAVLTNLANKPTA